MHIIFCLIIPALAVFMLLRRWEHPWRLKLPLLLLRRASIDSALLVEPRRVTAAHLPFDAAAQPRLQSGALLWASAATVTHTLADEHDRDAILAAVKPLGFTPDKFLARCPILRETEQDGLRGCIVRDGSRQRAYFTGAPARLLEACSLVWEQQEREKTSGDAQRIPTGEGLYGLATAPVDEGHVGPMTYLGSLQITAPDMDPALVEALLPRSWTLEVDPPQPSALRLHIAPQPIEMNSFTADSADWQARLTAGFERSLGECRMLARLLVFQLAFGLAGMLWQSPAWLIPAAGAFLLPCMRQLPALRPNARCIAALLWAILYPLVIGSFVQYAVPGTSALALALIASAACVTHAPWRITLPCAACVAALLWLVLQPTLPAALFCLVAGALHGLVIRLLLPWNVHEIP